MPIPQFIQDLRSRIGHDPLWLSGCTAIVLRHAPGQLDQPARSALELPGRPGAPGRPENQELLMVQRSDTGRWTPVTGIVDPGEHPASAAVREVSEEARVTCRVDRLVWVSTTPMVTHVNGDRAQYLDHCFACTWVSGEPEVGDDESLAARWFPLTDLPPLQPVFQRRLAAVLAGGEGCLLDEEPPPLPEWVHIEGEGCPGASGTTV